ncbi:hypothetical protein SS50377_24491 [Spironucleus salmonicida]|uniref:Uncharacterized protein n=1 Tax=Spironucleus salmonicida TaxID=348837 RepID=V6LYR1_9EUKA|nr:hypothetical protein SS50377_24491 [Spironucleus salmonicida]|eukprot:EST45964.1 Hypothetical protein SS50377_13943 [Spironucleus salmonicida]
MGKAENKARLLQFLETETGLTSVEMCKEVENSSLLDLASQKLSMDAKVVEFSFKVIQDNLYTETMRLEYLNMRFSIINYLFGKGVLQNTWNLQAEALKELISKIQETYNQFPTFLVSQRVSSVVKQLNNTSQKRSLMGIVLNEFGVISNFQDLNVKEYQQKLGGILDKVRKMEGDGVKSKKKNK